MDFSIFLLIVILFLAFNNGANDNFKGVASLYSCGQLNYKKALLLSSLATFLGVVVSVIYSASLLKSFSGKGLVSDENVILPEFILSVSLAAGITILVATRIGMPISTTHSLIGALIGSGLVSSNSDINFLKLIDTFLLPLIVSPIISIFLSYFFAKFFADFLKMKKTKVFHLITGSAVCFTRGLNDAPKIAGALFIYHYFSLQTSIALIGFAMVFGGLFYSKKIAITMSKKIALLNETEGVLASGTTAILVGFASCFALPVSTTHVSVGSIYGVSLLEKKQDNKIFKEIVLSWALTLPFSFIVSMFVFKIVQTFM